MLFLSKCSCSSGEIYWLLLFCCWVRKGKILLKVELYNQKPTFVRVEREFSWTPEQITLIWFSRKKSMRSCDVLLSRFMVTGWVLTFLYHVVFFPPPFPLTPPIHSTTSRWKKFATNKIFFISEILFLAFLHSTAIRKTFMWFLYYFCPRSNIECSREL